MARTLTPREAAAHWFSTKLGREIVPDHVEQVDLGQPVCGELLATKDALCMRAGGHKGRHESFRWQDDQGRHWRVVVDAG